jgi:hypothetical protein
MKFNLDTVKAAALTIATVLVGVKLLNMTTAGQKAVNWAFNK